MKRVLINWLQYLGFSPMMCLLVITLISGCEREERYSFPLISESSTQIKASYSVSKTTAKVGEEVIFTNNSQKDTSIFKNLQKAESLSRQTSGLLAPADKSSRELNVYYDFGDGDTSLTLNARHTYKKPGI